MTLICYGGQNRKQSALVRPNILFILSDDHRWDALGAAGNPKIKTPVLDQLARDGIYFRQATIYVSQCTPSRATLLTGLTPHQHGFLSNEVQHPDVSAKSGLTVATVPGLLQKAGYHTVLVGKWHLAPDPWSSGFSDTRIWMPPGSGPYVDPPLAQGRSRRTEIKQGFTNEIFIDDAVEFLNSAAAQDKPFFLWLAVTAPHLPMQPNPPRIEQLYRGQTTAQLLPPGFPINIPTNDFLHYYEAVSHLDEGVGRLLRTLKERKLADNTIVVFLGDNGFMMGSRGVGVRGGGGKVVPYEESVRIPLIVRVPGASPHGISNAPVSSLDLPPTFLALAGVAPPQEWYGRNLVALLRGDKQSNINEAYCEWTDNQGKTFGHLAYRLVRTPTHKLIVWEKVDKLSELYDLVNDPREEKNLVSERATRRIYNDLKRRLVVWLERTHDPARKWQKW